MADTGLYSFLANDQSATGGYTGMDLRRRVALAMMARERKFPKTFGEGLSAVGDSIGDVLMQRRLEREGADQDAKSTAAAAAIYGPGPVAEASPATTPAPVASADEPVSTMRSAGAPDVPVYDQGAKNPLDVAADVQVVDPTEKNPLDVAADTPDPWAGRSRAIAGIESGGAKDPYGSLGAVTRTGDRAIGKYQVMGANVPEWTKAATGTAMTPEQFRSSPDAQEAVFKHRFGGYVDKYGEEGAAKAWFGGERGMNNPNATDVHGRLTVSGYGQDYLNRLNNGGQAGPAPVPPTPRDSIARTLVAGPGAGSGAPPVMARGDDQGNVLPPAATPLPPQMPPQAQPQAQPQAPDQPQVPPQQAQPIGPRDDITRQLLSPVPSAPPQQFAQAPAATPQQAALPAPAAGTPTNIQPAPAAVPPAAAPVAQPRPQAPPYEMPKPVMPEPPPQPQMSAREAGARKGLAGPLGADPNFARAANQAIAEEQAKSKYEQDRAVALYNARIQHFNSQDTAYQTWQQNADARKAAAETHAAAMAKAPYELEKERQAVEAGKTPATKEVEGRLLQYDPVKRNWFDATPGGGAANPTLTETQAKDLLYYQNGKRALADLGNGDKLHSLWDWYTSGAPLGMGGKFASTQFQEQYNAARAFAAVVLRKESGAAVQPSELVDVMNRFIPKPGEPPEVSVQKKFMREGEIDGIRAGLGKGTIRADQFDAKFDDERARLKAAKEEARQGGKPEPGAGDLPPVVINSEAEKNALEKGRRYTLPGDAPGTHRVKK